MGTDECVESLRQCIRAGAACLRDSLAAPTIPLTLYAETGASELSVTKHNVRMCFLRLPVPWSWARVSQEELEVAREAVVGWARKALAV